MTRATLIDKVEARSAAMHSAFWILGLGTVGIKIAIPCLSDVWPYLATITGNEWLVPLIAVFLRLVPGTVSGCRSVPTVIGRSMGQLPSPAIAADVAVRLSSRIRVPNDAVTQT